MKKINTFYIRINSHLTISGVPSNAIDKARGYALNHPDSDKNWGCAHVSLKPNDKVIPFSEIKGK